MPITVRLPASRVRCRKEQSISYKTDSSGIFFSSLCLSDGTAIERPHTLTGRVKEQGDEPMLRHTTLCTVVVFIALMGNDAQAGDCDSLQGNAWGL